MQPRGPVLTSPKGVFRICLEYVCFSSGHRPPHLLVFTVPTCYVCRTRCHMRMCCSTGRPALSPAPVQVCWALGNLAYVSALAGDIIVRGGLAVLLRCLRSPAAENAAWALAILASHDSPAAQMALDPKMALAPLLRAARDAGSPALRRHAAVAVGLVAPGKHREEALRAGVLPHILAVMRDEDGDDRGTGLPKEFVSDRAIAVRSFCALTGASVAEAERAAKVPQDGAPPHHPEGAPDTHADSEVAVLDGAPGIGLQVCAGPRWSPPSLWPDMGWGAWPTPPGGSATEGGGVADTDLSSLYRVWLLGGRG